MKKETFDEIILGLSKREQVIGKQIPFYSLMNNVQNAGKYKELPVAAIVLAMFEYLTIEGSLKDRGVPYIEIQEFIKNVLESGYEIFLTEKDLGEFTSYIFKKITNEGSAFDYEYYNTTTKKVEVINTKYVISKLDRNNNGEVLIYITSEGMEFLLNTKEVNDEYKISVHVLLLQKMISTNNLEDVLRGVKNLNAEIKKQINKKRSLVETLQYASDTKFKEYFEYLEGAVNILTEDEEQIGQTKKSIEKYEEGILSKIKKKEISKEQEETIRSQIKQIVIELDMCLGNHQILLDEAVDLIRNREQIETNRLTRIFSSNFNIEENINRIVKNDNVDKLIYLLEPLFKPNLRKIFNMAKIDDMFNYKSKPDHENDEGNRKEKDLGEGEDFDKKIKENLDDNNMFYMRSLLELLDKEKNTDLRNFVDYIRNTYGEMPITMHDLRVFILELCQNDHNAWDYVDISQREAQTDIEKAFIETLKELNIEFENYKLSMRLLKGDLVYIDEQHDAFNVEIVCEKI